MKKKEKKKEEYIEYKPLTKLKKKDFLRLREGERETERRNIISFWMS